jgi:hypothetical protein
LLDSIDFVLFLVGRSFDLIFFFTVNWRENLCFGRQLEVRERLLVEVLSVSFVFASSQTWSSVCIDEECEDIAECFSGD